jgi:DNA-binding transcriptional LysR family regulator
MNEKKRPPPAPAAGNKRILQISRSQRFDSVPIAAFRSFVTVAETGGFAPASRDLRIAVSTVSKHVDVLEARLKTNLLLRTTRRVSLTDAGASFYQHCKSVLDQLDDVVESNLGPSELRGRLRIISPPSFTSRILSPALPDFLRQHPELRVELRVTTANLEFLQNGVDAAIRMTPDQPSSDSVRIGPAPSVLCASPDYLARHGTPKHPDELVGHSCLGGISSPYGESWPFKVKNEVIRQPVKSRFLSDTGDVLRDACISGLGIAGFYAFHVEDDLTAGRLVPVLQRFQADVSSIHIVRPSARYVSSSVQAFTDFVRDLWNARTSANRNAR